MKDLDPFIHMDQMGEVEYAPGEPKGTPWHPHRGFETVTYMLDGIMEHQDSQGGGGVISNGDTQWMTAGSGLLHIETPPEHLVLSGGLFHGIQLWVNLPKAQKWAAPKYQDIRGGDSALLSTEDGGALIRVIAGSVDGHDGPGSTNTPDHPRPRHGQPGRGVGAAVAAGVQRARLRPGRPGHGRRRAPPDPQGPTRPLRPRRHHPYCGLSVAAVRRAQPRRPRSWAAARSASRSRWPARS